MINSGTLNEVVCHLIAAALFGRSFGLLFRPFIEFIAGERERERDRHTDIQALHRRQQLMGRLSKCMSGVAASLLRKLPVCLYGLVAIPFVFSWIRTEHLSCGQQIFGAKARIGGSRNSPTRPERQRVCLGASTSWQDQLE